MRCADGNRMSSEWRAIKPGDLVKTYEGRILPVIRKYLNFVHANDEGKRILIKGKDIESVLE